jgi:hypothetical protein
MVQESLDGEQTAVFNRLRNLLTLSRGETTRLNEYYEGDRRLRQLGLAIPPELQSFTVFLGWPRVTVDGCEQRLDVTGFRLPGQAADSYLWENWQYNDLDELQSWAHTDALALARSYICVGTNRDDKDHPLVTVESPMEMVTLRDPATRHVVPAEFDALVGDGGWEVDGHGRPGCAQSGGCAGGADGESGSGYAEDGCVH